MSRRFQFSLTLVAVALFQGCGPGEPARTGSLLDPGVFVDVVHPYTAGASSGHHDPANQLATHVVHWKGGQVEVSVDRLHLIVDGRDYGAVESGDNVVVDATAGNSVQVNGQTRAPKNEQ
jgi:hypothetical protein